MEQKAIIDTSGMRKRGKAARPPEGPRRSSRRRSPRSRALLGDAPRRRDLLIEFLHRIQDALRPHLRRAHRRARAGDVARDDRGLRGRDVLPSLRRREGRRDAAARADGARLRNAVVPAGGSRGAARGARERLRRRRARHRRAVHRPLRARAGRRRRPQSDRPRDVDDGHGGGRRTSAPSPPTPRTSTTRRTARPAATARARACVRGERPLDDVLETMEDSGLRGLGGAGFRSAASGDRARRAGAAADGGQHRRGRAGHVQGSLLPRARSAPLSRRHADRGVGRRHRRHLRLSARRVRGVPGDPRRARSRRSRPIRRARCRASTCAAARARTSAAKSRR